MRSSATINDVFAALISVFYWLQNQHVLHQTPIEINPLLADQSEPGLKFETPEILRCRGMSNCKKYSVNGSKSSPLWLIPRAKHHDTLQILFQFCYDYFTSRLRQAGQSVLMVGDPVPSLVPCRNHFLIWAFRIFWSHQRRHCLS